MKRWKGLIPVNSGMVILICLVLASCASAEEPAVPIAAKVNGVVITREDLDRQLTQYKQYFAKMGIPVREAQMKELEKDVLNGLIGRELLYQESQRTGTKVDAKTISEQLDKIKKQFPSEKEYEKELAKNDLTEADLTAQLQKELTIKQYIDQKLSGKTDVSEQEAKAFYDENLDKFKSPAQVRASHILIKVDPEADEAKKAETKKKMEDIQARLKNGEDFAALAKEYSECPSAAKGGDLDYFSHGKMDPTFEEAAFGLEPGQVSDIVKTSFGYHLIKTVDKKPETTATFDEAKDKIIKNLSQQKFQKQVLELTKELRNKSEVETFTEPAAPESK